MTRRRWIADEFSRDRAALVGEHAAHLSRTLRARVGQQFEIACGDEVRQGTVICVTDDRVEFALGEELPAAQAVPITLLLAVFKFDRMEWAIEKCTELNVTTIVPVIARRTEKHLAQAAEKRVERWRRIAREASEQSRRLAPPEIDAPMKLMEALKAGRSAPSITATVATGHPVTATIPSEYPVSRLQEKRTHDLPANGPRTGVDAEKRHDSRQETIMSLSPVPTSLTEPRTGVDAEKRHGARQETILRPSPVLTSPTEPRSGGCDVSPGRKPWVDAPSGGLSRVATAQNRPDDSIAGVDLRIVLAETERALMLADILRAHRPQSLTLAIGPEGGWTPDELHSFAAAQFLSCSLGETILRAETAAIAAVAIARAEL